MSIEMEIYIYLIVTFIIIIYTILLQYKLWKKEIELEVYKKNMEKEMTHRIILEKTFNPNKEIKTNIENKVQEILSLIKKENEINFEPKNFQK